MPVFFFFDDSDAVPFSYLTPTRSVGALPPPYESAALPEAYLEFAIEDFKDRTSRGLVNAFGNVKRALHLTVDCLLNQYGLFTHYRKQHFPAKLALLDDIGLLPKTIMENLNVERNAVEHEYGTPTERRVGEALDVAKLLSLAMERMVDQTPHEAVVGLKGSSKHYVLQLDPLSGSLRILALRAKGKFGFVNGRRCFTGLLRNILHGTLESDIALAKRPWREIELKKAEAGEWLPIIRALVDVQRKQSRRGAFIALGDATETIPVTLPLPMLKGTSWAELLDRFLKDRPSRVTESPREPHATAGMSGRGDVNVSS